MPDQSKEIAELRALLMEPDVQALIPNLTRRLLLENARLGAAVSFYANPDTYFAIAFFPDPPCGEFMNDFSDADEWAQVGPYGRDMPGRLARAALEGRDE